MSALNTLHLKYAVEIEKAGSISQAAENLFMGQPTLSKTIKELESTLGYDIFFRTQRGVQTTKNGEVFLKHAKNILAEVERMEQIPLSDESLMQTLDCIVPRAGYIAHTFSEFAAALDPKKKIEMTYKETNTMRTINKISIGEYNMGIIRYQVEHESYFVDFLQQKNFHSELLYEFNAVALMNKRHPLAAKQNLEYSDFERCTELLYGDNTVPYFLNPKPTIHRSGFDKHIYIFERGTLFELLSAVGDAYMQMSPMPAELAKKHSLIQRKCDFPDGHMRDVLIYRDGYELIEAEKQFIRRLRQTIREISELSFE